MVHLDYTSVLVKIGETWSVNCGPLLLLIAIMVMPIECYSIREHELILLSELVKLMYNDDLIFLVSVAIMEFPYSVMTTTSYYIVGCVTKISGEFF